MNRIQLENMLQGTSAWRLEHPPDIQIDAPGPLDRTDNRCRIIEGYAWPPSVNVGEWISFYVSTTAPFYSLQLFRLGYYGGAGGRAVTSAWTHLTVGGSADPQPEPLMGGDAANWRPAILNGALAFPVPQNWVSGCYVAKLEEAGGTQSYIFFVIRDDFRASDLLMQCSVTTYQAYNGWGGDSSVYAYNNVTGIWHNVDGRPLSLRRPFLPSNSPGGRAGAGAGAFFVHDKGPDGDRTWPAGRDPELLSGATLYSCRAWEYGMVRWLEMHGYDVTYCTNLDTDQNQLTRSAHRIFLSVGHDEYWSLPAYTNVVSARDQHGTSLLWFSGNTVWNCIDLSQPGMMRVVGNFNPGGSQDPAVSNPPVPVTDYALVGGTWTFNAQDNYFVAPSCPAWLLDGVAIRADGSLGDRLLGYEGNGRAAEPWQSLLPPGIADILVGPDAQATWYTSRISGATVVSLSTIQWSWGLDDFTLETPDAAGPRMDAGTVRFTQNLIAHCLDCANMRADLPNGTYEIRSVSAYPQNLIVLDNGDPDAAVVVFGDGIWKSGNNQARWIVRRYDGPRSSGPIIGPYKAADDVWYTIRNQQNGQHLIVGDNGAQNGPVIVIGDRNGDWGQAPDNTQMMWRIWRYTSYAFSRPAYIIQNVCSGQLLIVGENGRMDGPVWVFGNYNGGWGEQEHNAQKLWTFTRVRRPLDGLVEFLTRLWRRVF